MTRCTSRIQRWTSTGQDGIIDRCTREAGHPVIEETIECEPYQTVTTKEWKTSYTRLIEAHQFLRPGHRVMWPDRAALPEIPEPEFCQQAWPGGLKYGILTECVRKNRHTGRHQNAKKDMQWWGPKLDAADIELAEALRKKIS